MKYNEIRLRKGKIDDIAILIEQEKGEVKS